MTIIIKTPEEIQIMREGGKILATILNNIKEYAEIGMTTKDLDNYSTKLFQKYGVKPSFNGYKGFPANLCTSINEQVVHTIPCDRILNDGDILTIDCGVYHKDFHTDAAITILMGNVQPDIQEFVYVVRKALNKGIGKIRKGVHFNVIGETIEKYINKHGYSIVKELTGHGIGRQLHEDPFIPNHKENKKGAIIEEGMTFAIEPIVNMGKHKIKTEKDKWTIRTLDGLPSCQWEHTIAMTEKGVEILTKL